MTELNAHDSPMEKRAVANAFCCRLLSPGGKDDIGGEWEENDRVFQLSFDAMGQACVMVWCGMVDCGGRSQTLVLYETIKGAVIVVLIGPNPLTASSVVICSRVRGSEH